MLLSAMHALQVAVDSAGHEAPWARYGPGFRGHVVMVEGSLVFEGFSTSRFGYGPFLILDRPATMPSPTMQFSPLVPRLPTI